MWVIFFPTFLDSTLHTFIFFGLLLVFNPWIYVLLKRPRTHLTMILRNVYGEVAPYNIMPNPIRSRQGFPFLYRGVALSKSHWTWATLVRMNHTHQSKTTNESRIRSRCDTSRQLRICSFQFLTFLTLKTLYHSNIKNVINVF